MPSSTVVFTSEFRVSSANDVTSPFISRIATSSRFLTVTIDPGRENEKGLLEVVSRHGASVKGRDCAFSREKEESSYGFTLALRNEGLLIPLMEDVRTLPFVKSFSLRT